MYVSSEMPLRKEEDYGTNSSGGRSEEYCFIALRRANSRMKAMLGEKTNKNVRFGVQMGMSEPRAGKMASEILPKLK